MLERTEECLGTLYLCYNNRKLRKVDNNIPFSWELKFIGRKIIPEKYYEIFDHNGYYYETEQYLMNDITVNIKPKIDVNNYIIEIDSYKAKDKSCGHGRPKTEFRNLSRRDVSHFSKILDSVTEDPASAQYEALKRSLVKGEVLPGGYIVDRVSAVGISLICGEETVILTKKKVLQVLDISRSYIDVLFNAETMKLAPGYIEEEDIPLYLAVFSKIDLTEYRDYEQLMKEAGVRVMLAEVDEGYPALVKAVKEGSIEKLSELIRFAPLVIDDHEDSIEPPLVIAAIRNDIKMVKMLLEGGAFSKEGCYKDHILITPLLAAIENKNYEMVKVLCNHSAAEEDDIKEEDLEWLSASYRLKAGLREIYNAIERNQDYTAFKTILPFAIRNQKEIKFKPEFFSGLNSSDIDYVISFEDAKIHWPVSLVKQVYMEDRKKCIRMVQQGCDKEVIDLSIDSGDIELFKSGLKNNLDISEPPSFKTEQIYKRGGEWYQALLNLASGKKGYSYILASRNRFLQDLIEEENYEEFMLSIKKMDCEIPLDSTLRGFTKNLSEGRVLSEEMKNCIFYVFDSCKYISDQKIMTYEFRRFVELMISYGDSKLVKKYMETFLRLIIESDQVFYDDYKSMVLYRTDYLYMDLLDKRLKYDETRSPTEDWIRIYGFTTYYMETICKVIKKILISVSFQKELSECSRWKEALKLLLSVCPITKIDEAIATSRKGNIGTFWGLSSALEYALRLKIEDEEVLSLLQV